MVDSDQPSGSSPFDATSSHRISSMVNSGAAQLIFIGNHLDKSMVSSRQGGNRLSERVPGTLGHSCGVFEVDAGADADAGGLKKPCMI